MRVLLDSHAVVWWLVDDQRLGPLARQTVEDAELVAVSVVTPWELGIKRAAGKLDLPDDYLSPLVDQAFRFVEITVDHVEAAVALPRHHRDPFDRMLVAQARIEALHLLTADRALEPYDVDRLDARR